MLAVRTHELARHAVELPAAEAKQSCARRGRGGRRVRATQDISHARQQFAEIHGFGEIIVRAHFETENAVHLVGAACQDDEGHVARGAQASTEAHAVFLAEMNVEHHEIDARTLERAQHAAAAAGRGDPIAEPLQLAGERGTRLAVFVDYEYVFVCGHCTFVSIATSGLKEFHSAEALHSVTLRNNSPRTARRIAGRIA